MGSSETTHLKATKQRQLLKVKKQKPRTKIFLIIVIIYFALRIVRALDRHGILG